MPFPRLCPELVSALAKRGITEPTPPQADVIPRILDGGNLLLVAPTGIGKTEAAMLPILDTIKATKGKKTGFRCIYVTPLRALNRDMLRRMSEYGEALGITVGVRHGDTSQAERNDQSRNPPEILITTPETLQVLFTGKRLIQHLKAVEWVVIDEIHELSNTERGAQLSVALERLTLVAGEYQRIGLSATVGDPQAVANFLVGPRRKVEIRKHDTFREFDIRVESPPPMEDAKLIDRLQGDPDIIGVMARAREIVDSGRSTLFFVNTRETAEWLAARYRLWDETFPVEVHHGSLSKETRMEMEDRFKSGDVKALICTSSLELGIDVGTTDMVIQYNSARQVSRMIQRAGRAGHRVGEKIRARVLATAPDEVAEAMVIARRCDAKELEFWEGRPLPMSVVANQLIAMTMSGQADKELAFRVFSGAWPFRDISMQDIEGVLEQLQSIRMVFVEDDGSFRRSRKGMAYFYDNISMIPDERSYLIRDIGTRAIIGTLDESFVASFAEEYAMFIAKGRTWRIVEMREDELLVEEAREVGSVPNWVGSDIPVPYEVAMEVGRMRRLRNFSDYPGDDGCVAIVSKYLADQDERFEMPTDRKVVVETGDRLAIVNCCFGSRVNETLGKIYAALLTARLGESVGMTADPYRVILELPRNMRKDDIVQTVKSVKPGTIEALSRMTIVNSSFLRWRFVFVAKKFGIIEKNADHRFMNFSRLFDLHRDTPAYREAVNKVLWEDLDIPNTEKVVSMMSSGEIEVVQGGISTIGLEGITRSKELMQPVRADHSILMALKKRLEDEILFASCLNCASQWRFRVGDAPKRFVCPHCGGNMIAVLKGYERENINLVKHKELSEQERKDRLRLSRNANLVNEHGRRAVICLAGRGIGPDAASRILRSFYDDEDEFYRDIMNAEILYAKNKRFWD
ncbi:MAG: DEAD/DEAH box helicase [Thermoplasmata archaeon]|nr:DEAD/DEAH box helicase [Thermoplasmata archaeon]